MPRKPSSPPPAYAGPDATPVDTLFLSRVLDAIDGLVFVKDAQRRFVYANSRFLKACGMSDVTGLRSEDYEPEEKAAVFRKNDELVLATGKPVIWEGATGENQWEVIRRLPFAMPDGSTGILSVIFDVTDFHDMQVEVEALRRTEALALHDPLTGLPNRRHLETRFEAIAISERAQTMLLHLDLDGFKPINDDHGHAAGDAILVEISRRMSEALDDGKFAARIGGDEFVILGPFESLAAAQSWAEALLERIRAPVDFDHLKLQVGSSCGIVQGDTVAFELDAMMHAADMALYLAKENGRNRVELFTPALSESLEADKRRTEQMHKGLQRREFFPLYQPQIDLKTGEVVGFEALARWRHPEQGLIPPQGFLPLFEAQGLLGELDIMILDAVIEDTRHLRSLGLSPKRVSVNMSGALLQRPDLLDVFGARAPFGFNLGIELSEAVPYETLDDATRFNIDCLREMGCEFEVDDFGSAQASILGVIGLRPDRLKIDKGLVLPMLESDQNGLIVKAILEIAGALSIPVVAEGVETRAHVEALRRLGCDLGQGYVFAPPLHLRDLPSFIRSREKDIAGRKLG